MNREEAGMNYRVLGILCLLTFVTADVQAKKWNTFEGWADYLSRYRTECVPPFAKLRNRTKVVIGKSTFRLEGTKLVELKPRLRANTRIGILSAPKDGSSVTLDNVRNFVKAFKARDVHWIVANGDLAYDPAALPDILDVLAQSEVPVFVSVGNGESVAPFNDAVLEAMTKHKNIFNTNFIRWVEGAGVGMFTVPGYYDANYIHPPDGCEYEKEDVSKISELARRSRNKRKLLVSHGPPLGNNANGLDVIHNGRNVGDGALNQLMNKAKIQYGIFGHILESGGRGVNAAQEPVSVGTKSKTLWVNVGSASAIPWKMVDGHFEEGMGMVMTIGKDSASYEVIKAAEARSLRWGGGQP